MTEEDRPHHHGNLKTALIEAGIALLQEGGTAGLTLRKAAARAGVSHAAPAHHFNGLPGLLTAIATVAHRRFAAAMVARRALAADRPYDQLLAICEGYLDFAAQNAALFQIMFVSHEVDHSEAECAAASGNSYAILQAACLPFATAEGQNTALEHAVWALVHGYAMLGLGQATENVPPYRPAPPFSAHLARLMSQNC